MAVYGICKNSTGHKLKIKIPSSGNLYLVRDNKNWYKIPEALRKIIIKRVEEAFTFNGKKVMVVKPVDENSIPKDINFADAVVRVYDEAADGRKKIWEQYKKQENQIKIKCPKFQGIKWTEPAGDYGNAIPDKRILVDDKKQYFICLSEGAVYLSFIREAAGGFIHKTDDIDYKKPLVQLPAEAQKKVAYGIGNCIAHEARHQLNLKEHADAGIGMDGNKIPNNVLYGMASSFSASDQSNIKDKIKQLYLMQCTNPTISINR